MKIKTSELTGAALDWAVAKAIGEYKPVAVPSYSTDWAQGGPIIERKNIGLVCQQPESTQRCAYRQTPDGEVFYYYGPTQLIAAMRCYVASELGDEVEIPEELT
jgi:hypothetical protein